MSFLRVLLPVAIFLSSISLRAQERSTDLRVPSRSSVGFYLSVDDVHLRDEWVSPLIHRGTMLSPSLSFESEVGQDRHRIDASLSSGTLYSNPLALDASYYSGSLAYTYLRSSYHTYVVGFPLHLLLGGGVSSSFWISDYRKGIIPYRSFIKSWYWRHALNLTLHGDCSLSEDKIFSVLVSTPLFRLVSRPEYSILDESTSEVAHNFLNAATYLSAEYFWNSVDIVSRVEYMQRLSPRISLHLAYQVGYESCSIPLSMQALGQNVIVGVACLF